LSSRDTARPTESSLLARRDPHSGCRVSVIVPTRNRHALLERMLLRIRSQTFGDFEVIVVDDGSDAASRHACSDSLGRLDSRFRVIELGIPGGPGHGPSVARNAGIDAATGDIITFCDDDDFWTGDTHLAAMVDVFDSQPEVDLYIANQTAVSHLGATERSDWLPALVGMVAGRPRTHAHGYRIALDELVRAGGFAQLNILALRRTTAQAIGGFWTRTSYEEDRDFFWRAADAARAVFFNPDVIAQHNVPDPARQNNLSRRFSQAERWLLSALVSQHIAMKVDSTAIRALCLSYEGDILRRLSRYWSDEGKHALGWQYARRALAARMSLKWALYTAALGCRQLLRKGQA
jgi:glycosyltransferase involved in cell wall biosynthesis